MVPGAATALVGDGDYSAGGTSHGQGDSDQGTGLKVRTRTQIPSERRRDLKRLAHARKAAKLHDELYLEELLAYCGKWAKNAGPRSLACADHSLLLNLASSIPASIVIKNRQGKILWANPYFENLIGLSLQELRGRTVKDISPSHFASLVATRDERVSHGRAMLALERVPTRKSERLRLTLRFPIMRGDKVSRIALVAIDLPKAPVIVGPLFEIEMRRQTA